MATGLNAGCCSISRPPLDFTYKPANHPDWSDKPGFWDPYAVIEICLPTITRSVYPATRTMQLEKPTFEHPCGQEIVDGEICWGIQMYTETWKMELEECISLKPERALAVLLTYLRQRGPFLVWMYRGKETAHTIGRYLARTAIQNISQLPVLERSSVIALGRHLSHLLRIACGHRLINMPKIVSKVWGPIFIKVENDKDAFPQVNLTEEEKLGVAIELFGGKDLNPGVTSVQIPQTASGPYQSYAPPIGGYPPQGTVAPPPLPVAFDAYPGAGQPVGYPPPVPPPPMANYGPSAVPIGAPMGGSPYGQPPPPPQPNYAGYQPSAPGAVPPGPSYGYAQPQAPQQPYMFDKKGKPYTIVYKDGKPKKRSGRRPLSVSPALVACLAAGAASGYIAGKMFGGLGRTLGYGLGGWGGGWGRPFGRCGSWSSLSSFSSGSWSS
ncbi:unnamed protein product [Mesocestoides corti]|uniref:Uncharacterized protein n=1 Tax=Mesocestoides corti TaxID=53468 RepID=A0A0R3U411_MESCO|nr:unnamed protein product [Mesocestoides corti]